MSSKLSWSSPTLASNPDIDSSQTYSSEQTNLQDGSKCRLQAIVETALNIKFIQENIPALITSNSKVKI